MSRTRSETVTPRAEQPSAEDRLDSEARLGPGWAVFFTVWATMFGLLLVYELWGLVTALLRPRG